MNEAAADTPNPPPTHDAGEAWPINNLWNKYEEIAMHFNDLLIRLRTQALGVANV